MHAAIQARAVGQTGERIARRLLAQLPRGTADEREEREPEHAQAEAEQQVQRTRVRADRRRRRRVVHVDLEHGRDRAVRREPQRHVDLEGRLVDPVAVVVLRPLDLGPRRARERVAHVLAEPDRADLPAVVGVDPAPVGGEEVDVADRALAGRDAGDGRVQGGEDRRAQPPRH
jgi:hypothetical protein